jgi:hypothetical protein
MGGVSILGKSLGRNVALTGFHMGLRPTHRDESAWQGSLIPNKLPATFEGV